MHRGSKQRKTFLVKPTMAEGLTINGHSPVHRESVAGNLDVPIEKGKKKPFIIGVAGGTCCGKVSIRYEDAHEVLH